MRTGLRVKGIAVLTKRLRRGAKEIEIDVRKLLRRLMNTTKTRLKRAVPKRSGATVQSIKYRERKSLSTLTFEVYSESQIMTFLELGTKAHGPKKAKALFIPLTAAARSAGKGKNFGRDFILAKKVRGIKKGEYFKKEERRQRKRIPRQVQSRIAKTLKRVGLA